MILAFLLLSVQVSFLLGGLEGVLDNHDSSGFDQRSFLNLGLKIRAGKKLTDGNRHPLYPALLALFARREWSYFTGGKLLSLGLGALTLLLIFWLTRRLRGAEVALAVTFLLSLNPIYRRVTSHVMAESLLVGLFFLSWHLTRQGFKRQPLWVSAGAMAALAYLTKATGQLLAMAFLLTVLLVYGRGIQRAWRGVAGYLAAYGLTAAPLWAYNVVRYGHPFYNFNTAHVMWFDHWEDKYAQGPLPTLGSYLRTHALMEMLQRQWVGLGDALAAWGQATLPWGQGGTPGDISPWWGVLVLAGLIVISIRGVRHARGNAGLGGDVYSGVLCTLTFLLFAWYAQAYIAPRFFVPLAPLVYLHMADGAVRWGRDLLGRVRRWAPMRLSTLRGLGLLACAVLGLAWTLEGTDISRAVGEDPFVSDRAYNAESDVLFTWFQDNLPPDVNFLWGPSTTFGSWRYEQGYDFEEIPSGMDAWRELEAHVHRERCRYAIVDTHTYHRRQALLSPFFAVEQGRIRMEAAPPGWALTYVQPGLPCRWCVFQLLDQQPISRPLSLTLGGQIRLLGYDVPDGTVQAGGHLRFTLYWQPTAPVHEDYTVFTHLLSPQGVLLAQVDRQPLQGRVPTGRWLPGAIYADRFDMALPPDIPPDEAQLEVGLYQLATMERLPVVTADGHRLSGGRVLLPTPIIVKPPTGEREGS